MYINVFKTIPIIILLVLSCNREWNNPLENEKENGQIEQVVNFQDANLESAMREVINKPTGNIYPADLNKIVKLDCCNKGIIQLWGLEYCNNLEILKIWGNSIYDISLLSTFTKIEELYLGYNDWNNSLFYGNNISNISPIENLTNLKVLYLPNNPVNNLTPLSNLINLTELCLFKNQIQDDDLRMLSNLTNLNMLFIDNNNLKNVSALGNLTQIEFLTIHSNQIEDLSFITNYKNINHLLLHWNNINDISPLANLTTLEIISLEHNNIQNIASITNLINLNYLRLDQNNINNITPLLSCFNQGGFKQDSYIDIRNNNMNIQNGSSNYNVVNTLINNGVTVDYMEGNIIN
jgi:internalin A